MNLWVNLFTIIWSFNKLNFPLWVKTGIGSVPVLISYTRTSLSMFAWEAFIHYSPFSIFFSVIFFKCVCYGISNNQYLYELTFYNCLLLYISLFLTVQHWWFLTTEYIVFFIVTLVQSFVICQEIIAWFHKLRNQIIL